MKAAVYDRPGAPEVLHLADVPDPVAGPGDVLIQVQAISIEGGDTLARGDTSAPETPGPHIVGYQAAGTVLQVGEAVTRFSEGDAVVTVSFDGSHAELRSVPEAVCWAVPAGLAVESASAIPIPFGTASDCLFEFGRLQAGEVALVHAGASGVGIAAIQLAKAAGATVLATASADAKLERLAELGLDHGINYRTSNFVEEARRLTDGHGADVIVDSVGGRTLQDSLRALAYRGRCVTVGDAGREPGRPLDISELRGNNQSLSGYFLGAELFTGTRAYAMIEDLFARVAAGDLRVVIDRTYPLAEAAAAHAYIESRQSFGRVLLIP
jgi:NADPH:quinone reductase